MKRISISILALLALALLVSAYSQSGAIKREDVTAQPLTSQPAGTSHVIDLIRTGAQAGQTAPKAQPRQPAKAKKILVNEVPKDLEGISLKNGVFMLKQGYKFVNQTSNTVVVALKANGATTGTFFCGCTVEAGSGKTPSGDCEARVRNDQNGVGTITCQKKEGNPCNDTCLMSAKKTNQIFRLAIY